MKQTVQANLESRSPPYGNPHSAFKLVRDLKVLIPEIRSAQPWTSIPQIPKSNLPSPKSFLSSKWNVPLRQSICLACRKPQVQSLASLIQGSQVEVMWKTNAWWDPDSVSWQMNPKSISLVGTLNFCSVPMGMWSFIWLGLALHRMASYWHAFVLYMYRLPFLLQISEQAAFFRPLPHVT